MGLGGKVGVLPQAVPNKALHLFVREEKSPLDGVLESH